MEQIRSYRRRGTPDLPMAVYTDDAKIANAHPKPEYHPETEIVRVLSGQVELQLSGVTKSFRKGDIFLIPGNAVHRYRHFSPDAMICSLIFFPAAIAMQPEHYFQKTFVQPLLEERLQMPGLLQPEHPAYEAVCAHFDLLQSCRIFSPDYQVRRFFGLMGVCTALLPYCTVISGDRPPADPGNEAVKLCMRYIHNQYNRKITLEILSEYCHLHPNYLCALFKSYTGQTIFEYLAQHRIETAKELIKSEELSMGKVAELVGFHSESLFYQKFKQITGMTPKAYAKQHREK